MPFLLLIIGAAMVISAARGTQGELGQQLGKDFQGGGNMLEFFGLIILIGLMGYVPEFKRFAMALIGLVLLSAVLARKKLFGEISQAVTSSPTSLSEISLPNPSSSSSSSSSGSSNSSGGSGTSSLGKDVGNLVGDVVNVGVEYGTYGVG